MNEADENTLRRLLAQFRNENWPGFCLMVGQVFIHRMGDEKIAQMIATEEDDIPASAVIACTGVHTTAAILGAIAPLIERQKYEVEGDGGGEPPTESQEGEAP